MGLGVDVVGGCWAELPTCCQEYCQETDGFYLSHFKPFTCAPELPTGMFYFPFYMLFFKKKIIYYLL